MKYSLTVADALSLKKGDIVALPTETVYGSEQPKEKMIRQFQKSMI